MGSCPEGMKPSPGGGCINQHGATPSFGAGGGARRGNARRGVKKYPHGGMHGGPRATGTRTAPSGTAQGWYGGTEGQWVEENWISIPQQADCFFWNCECTCLNQSTGQQINHEPGCSDWTGCCIYDHECVQECNNACNQLDGSTYIPPTPGHARAPINRRGGRTKPLPGAPGPSRQWTDPTADDYDFTGGWWGGDQRRGGRVGRKKYRRGGRTRPVPKKRAGGKARGKAKGRVRGRAGGRRGRRR